MLLFFAHSYKLLESNRRSYSILNDLRMFLILVIDAVLTLVITSVACINAICNKYLAYDEYMTSLN